MVRQQSRQTVPVRDGTRIPARRVFDSNTIDVLHGANDPRVPLGEAEQIAEEAAEHVPVEKLVFDDEGHGISKLENRLEAYPRIVDFLDEHVR